MFARGDERSVSRSQSPGWGTGGNLFHVTQVATHESGGT
jgi:hypothetical protein